MPIYAIFVSYINDNSMAIYITKKKFSEPDFEFVERKGIGHPDTLSDALGEYLSAKYSEFTQNKFGAVLHHNFDKVGLLGGSSDVKFGKGTMTEPIRVLLNGRASTKFGDKEIDLKKMLTKWTQELLAEKLPMINVKKDLEFHYNLSSKSSPGKTTEKSSEKGTRKYWFEPRGLFDLQETKKLVSNDTSLGVGYAPYSNLEMLVLKIEGFLTAKSFRNKHPWMGTDVKVMAFRRGSKYYLTLCIPQIADFVPNQAAYKKNITTARKAIEKICRDNKVKNFELYTNTRDNFENNELYLTATGSSIESGDEGLVGRGNRINGVISPMRLMSMEGACGKNPVYHIGKIYYVAANEISKKIYKKFGVSNEVSLSSQSGRDLLDPWITSVTIPNNFKKSSELEQFIKKELRNIPKYTQLLIQQKIKLY